MGVLMKNKEKQNTNREYESRNNYSTINNIEKDRRISLP